MALKVSPAAVKGISHPGWQLAVNQKAIKRQTPHPLLVRDQSSAPICNLHLRVNDFLKKQIIQARKIIDPAFSKELAAVVFGPRNFYDFPLARFLENGIVCGLDLNDAAMAEARSRLDERLKAGFLTLSMDASLLANEVLDTVLIVAKKNRTLNDHMFAELRDKIEEDEVRRNLPFNDNSLDMAVSTSTALCFVTYLFNSIIEHLWIQYGKKESWDFLSEKTSQKGARLKGDLLRNSMNAIFHKIVRAHLLEMRRIVKKRGVIFISDHLMKVDAVNDRGSFNLYPEMLVPADLVLKDVRIKTAHNTLRLAVPNEIRNIIISGRDNLESIIEKCGKFKVVTKLYFWNVNCPGAASLGAPGEYFLDVMLVLRPA